LLGCLGPCAGLLQRWLLLCLLRQWLHGRNGQQKVLLLQFWLLLLLL
jgi:hypothetical protein